MSNLSYYLNTKHFHCLGLVAEYAAHFNHLINMSFDCKDER